MRNKLIGIAVILASLSACSTVTITPGSQQKVPSSSIAPSYQQTHHFFLWGLVGKTSIDVNEVCGGQKVKQMQTQTTFLNGLLGGLTIGIYAPHTAKIWCE